MGNTEQLSALKELAHALLDEVELLAEEGGPAARPDEVGEAGGDFYEMIKAYEIFLIRRALLRARGNQARAARMLRLKPPTLHHKMKTYKIDADQKTAARGDRVEMAGRSDACARNQATQ